MSTQRTDRVLNAYRIGDPDGRHDIYDDEGSQLYPGRWNTRNSPVVYCSEHYSTAMLEKLVHANGVMPPNRHYITITIPNGISFERFSGAAHPGWSGQSEDICKEYGEAWVLEQRSAILLVPSIPARVETNILINLAHEESSKITYELTSPIWWDERLFG